MSRLSGDGHLAALIDERGHAPDPRGLYELTEGQLLDLMDAARALGERQSLTEDAEHTAVTSP